MAGPWVPVTRALRDHVMGIDRTSDGHSLPVLWASSAHFTGWFLDTILSKRIRIFLYVVDYNFVFLYNALWWFDDTSIEIMILLWYFFVNIFGSVILQIVMYQWFICKQWYFETFFKKKHLRANIKNGWICVICKRLLASFSWKIQKVRKKLQKACQSHFFLLYLHP